MRRLTLVVFLGMMILAMLVAAVPTPASASYHGQENYTYGSETYDYDKDIQEPSHLAYIFDKGVYFIDYAKDDIFFHLGKWYKRVQGAWFAGATYRGPWESLPLSNVPRPVIELPEDYRTAFDRYGSVPYRYVVGKKKRDQDYDDYYSGDYGYQGYYYPGEYYYPQRNYYYPGRSSGNFLNGRTGRFRYRIGPFLGDGHRDHGRHNGYGYRGGRFYLHYGDRRH